MIAIFISVFTLSSVPSLGTLSFCSFLRNNNPFSHFMLESVRSATRTWQSQQRPLSDGNQSPAATDFAFFHLSKDGVDVR